MTFGTGGVDRPGMRPTSSESEFPESDSDIAHDRNRKQDRTLSCVQPVNWPIDCDTGYSGTIFIIRTLLADRDEFVNNLPQAGASPCCQTLQRTNQRGENVYS
jgi:hypothetical protein